MNLFAMLWLVMVCLCFGDLKMWYFSVLGSCGWGCLPHWTVSTLLPPLRRVSSCPHLSSGSAVWSVSSLLWTEEFSHSFRIMYKDYIESETLTEGLNPHVLCWAYSTGSREPFPVSPSHWAGRISYQWQGSQEMTFVLRFIPLLLCHLLIL